MNGKADNPDYVYPYDETPLEPQWREALERSGAGRTGTPHDITLAFAGLAFRLRCPLPPAEMLHPGTLRFAVEGVEPTHEIELHFSSEDREYFLVPNGVDERVMALQSESPDGAVYASFYHAMMRMEPEKRSARAVLLRRPDSFSRRHAVDILMWALLRETEHEREAVYLHGTAVTQADEKGAMVACAVSGGGKSTFSNVMYWRAGRRVLSDECVALFRRNGEWMVSGTPFGGTMRWPGMHPLRKFILLEKSPRSVLKPCSRAHALARLSAGIRSTHRNSRAYFNHCTGVLALALEKVPCYTLSFRPEESIGEML